ncbi:hypothetical protein ACFL6E_00830 [Candidatus Neomarinimicrobiota bacterium]
MNNTEKTGIEQGSGKNNFIMHWWHKLADESASLVLDWAIIVAVAILVVVIYVPKKIWGEEDAARNESRRRMVIINDAEEFYNVITGNYTTDGEFLFKLVAQTYDSLIADSTFISDQIVHVNGMPYSVNIPEIVFEQLDTTFTVGRALRINVLDTTYTVLVWNDEIGASDTSYVNGIRGLNLFKEDPNFREVVAVTPGEHSEVITEYEWNRYPLDFELLTNTVTDDPYLIAIDSTGMILTVASPLPRNYKETRYAFFTFRGGNHGSITDGDVSWIKN